MSNCQRSFPLHPMFKALFEFVKTHDFESLDLGKIQIKGDDLYVMNLNVDGANKLAQPLEMHRKYIDVHIVLAGEEEIGWKPTDEVALSTAYDEVADCALSQQKPAFYAKLHSGEYAIMFPEDAHAPAIGEGKIRKLIGKVRI